MEKRLENKETAKMKCHICGSQLAAVSTALPFKINGDLIVILKEVPVLQCDSCSEYLLKDNVLSRVEEILGRVDPAAELEIIKYAA
jgi:YgiT-type zinc finger domain-containing protein